VKVVADLEVHSKYARAVSQQMTISTIAEWAVKKGIDLVGTGDFTHPLWFRELETNLEEAGEGIYKLKNSDLETRFMLTSEVSCMYKHNGRGRRVHFLVYLPTLNDVRKFNQALSQAGANLFSDGRPIMGLSLAQVAQIALEVNPQALLIPAHVWTPWFGFYGSMSGYDSLEEAFGNLAKNIPAVETGLSSDPAMNWRIAELENRAIVSFGDAHSPQKLGREATVFEMPEMSFENVRKLNIASTIEFYPEEGKYHYTGHRNCKVVYSPKMARKRGLTCPICSRPLTVGVMSRVEELAKQDVEVERSQDKFGVSWVKDKKGKRPPYVMLVPLLEILAEALSAGVNTKKVVGVYEQLLVHFKSEFAILLKTEISEIAKIAGAKVAEGVAKVRSGDIVIEPGYDGVFGKVKIWSADSAPQESLDQASLF
jgi:uncharacterized protein (TIGR00375 family)